jgi:hypothetical protein
MWSFRADATYLAVAHHLLEDDPTGFDLFAVYLGGPDVVGHRFWRHLHPELYVHPPGREELENFHGVIEATYTWVDRAIGRLVDAAGPDATVWVVSDHGMEAVRRRARFDPRDPPADLSSGHHRRPLPGVVVAAGPDILPGETPVKGLERAGLDSAGSVFDVTPTLLALLGLPVADDMAGRVLTGWIRPDFLRRHPVVRVATHDDPAWQEAHRRLPGASLGSEERLEQLRALGYLD